MNAIKTKRTTDEMQPVFDDILGQNISASHADIVLVMGRFAKKVLAKIEAGEKLTEADKIRVQAAYKTADQALTTDNQINRYRFDKHRKSTEANAAIVKKMKAGMAIPATAQTIAPVTASATFEPLSTVNTPEMDAAADEQVRAYETQHEAVQALAQVAVREAIAAPKASFMQRLRDRITVPVAASIATVAAAVVAAGIVFGVSTLPTAQYDQDQIASNDADKTIVTAEQAAPTLTAPAAMANVQIVDMSGAMAWVNALISGAAEVAEAETHAETDAEPTKEVAAPAMPEPYILNGVPYFPAPDYAQHIPNMLFALDDGDLYVPVSVSEVAEAENNAAETSNIAAMTFLGSSVFEGKDIDKIAAEMGLPEAESNAPIMVADATNVENNDKVIFNPTTTFRVTEGYENQNVAGFGTPMPEYIMVSSTVPSDLQQTGAISSTVTNNQPIYGDLFKVSASALPTNIALANKNALPSAEVTLVAGALPSADPIIKPASAFPTVNIKADENALPIAAAKQQQKDMVKTSERFADLDTNVSPFKSVAQMSVNSTEAAVATITKMFAENAVPASIQKELAKIGKSPINADNYDAMRIYDAGLSAINYAKTYDSFNNVMSVFNYLSNEDLGKASALAKDAVEKQAWLEKKSGIKKVEIAMISTPK